MTKKYAVLFPGQGSQYIGMGRDLAQNFAVARSVFDEVDETLHQSLSRLMFDGDLDTLTQTQNAQPAIMAVSMAIWRVLMTESSLAPDIACLSGHSLGEYSALCAGGSLTLSQTAQLLQVRGLAMAEAARQKSGGMLALLGTTPEQSLEIAQKAECYVANDNCPGQVVLSGTLANLTTAKMLAETMGIRRALPLAVAGAFHSPLMQSARDKLEKALTDISFNSTKFPIYFNVLADIQNDPTQFKDLLLKQLVSPVRFREILQNIPQTDFVECGPGKVLSGLVKRTRPEATVVDTNSLENLKSLLG